MKVSYSTVFILAAAALIALVSLALTPPLSVKAPYIIKFDQGASFKQLNPEKLAHALSVSHPVPGSKALFDGRLVIPRRQMEEAAGYAGAQGNPSPMPPPTHSVHVSQCVGFATDEDVQAFFNALR